MTMHGFSPHVIALVDLALTEDLSGGDATTGAIFDGTERSSGKVVAKAPLVLAGGGIFSYVMERVAALPGAPRIPMSIDFEISDGVAVHPGTTLATMHGATVSLLRAERVALNLLQRMSGIATQVRAFVSALGDDTAITDTRKTTPGLRELERYAVRIGGGHNHRYNLSAGILIKENHIAAAGTLTLAVNRCRENAPHPLKIEVEVGTLEQLGEALGAGADIVMLDNMSMETMREAVGIIDGRALIEVSGNVTLDRCEALATLGVDFVSSGALTHSVKAADISMLFDPPKS